MDVGEKGVHVGYDGCEGYAVGSEKRIGDRAHGVEWERKL